jgi:hypothetical protein
MFHYFITENLRFLEIQDSPIFNDQGKFVSILLGLYGQYNELHSNILSLKDMYRESFRNFRQFAEYTDKKMCEFSNIFV